MDLDRILIIILDVVSTVGFFTVTGTDPLSIAIQLFLWLSVLTATVYATEVSVALSDARIWWNVLVVSVVMTVPQAAGAISLAYHGLYTAAWIDTIASTIVDSVIITGLIRRPIIGSEIIHDFVPNILLWSIAALSLNFVVLFPSIVLMPMTHLTYLALGYVILPALLVYRVKSEVGGIPPVSHILTLALNTVAMGVGSWYLIQTISQIEVSQVQMGVLATTLASLPDFLTAMFMRAAFSTLLYEASDYELVATMLAGAIHDQISVPALILIFAPNAYLYYPHLLNIIAVLLKFTLLRRRWYWTVGLPFALLVLALPTLFVAV